jgi:hypothetical protein
MDADDIPFDSWHDDLNWPEEPRRGGPPTGYWRTAKGDDIAFVDMEHSHLLNTIAWVERQFRQLQDTFCDGALDIDLIYPAHSGLVAEARRRRLIPRGKDRMVTP